MVTIELKDLLLYSKHGIFEGEPVLAAPFEVSVILNYQEDPESVFFQLSETIDYAAVFEIVKAQMDIPSPLLEQVALRISIKLKETYPQILESVVSIYKLNPPVRQFEGKLGIRLHKTYSN
ncbi:MAG: dihydroneopterin aldolase [Chitinophagaceae bacterium]|uniref:dihydroneopterin aldolase n=1 Tax=unclassified Paraflavitalea TaxID=2798305 RepID=UPI003D32547F|nr:dihydroneopterin aldolase [Chitinophagaceae bacterium]